jgi:hypothetical protein
MLLVLPPHGRALRPTERNLDPWATRRMPPDTARDPMPRPAVSGGPTDDRPGQPSVPLRMRKLTGEADDQAWFSPLAGARLLLHAGAESRGHRTAFRFERLLLTALRSIVGSPPNVVVVFSARMSRYCGMREISPTCALFATWQRSRRPHWEARGYAATQPDRGCTSCVETPERFATNHSAAAWASSRKSLGSTGAA